MFACLFLTSKLCLASFKARPGKPTRSWRAAVHRMTLGCCIVHLGLFLCMLYSSWQGDGRIFFQVTLSFAQSSEGLFLHASELTSQKILSGVKKIKCLTLLSECLVFDIPERTALWKSAASYFDHERFPFLFSFSLSQLHQLKEYGCIVTPFTAFRGAIFSKVHNYSQQITEGQLPVWPRQNLPGTSD